MVSPIAHGAVADSFMPIDPLDDQLAEHTDKAWMGTDGLTPDHRETDRVTELAGLLV